MSALDIAQVHATALPTIVGNGAVKAYSGRTNLHHPPLAIGSGEEHRRASFFISLLFKSANPILASASVSPSPLAYYLFMAWQSGLMAMSGAINHIRPLDVSAQHRNLTAESLHSATKPHTTSSK